MSPASLAAARWCAWPTETCTHAFASHGSSLPQVFDEPGVTRDRTYGQGFWGAHEFTVVDTGGLVCAVCWKVPGSADPTRRPGRTPRTLLGRGCPVHSGGPPPPLNACGEAAARPPGISPGRATTAGNPRAQQRICPVLWPSPVPSPRELHPAQVFDDDPDEVFLPQIRQQALAALGEADVAVMVVDGKEGCTVLDGDIAAFLRKQDVPVVLAVNKCESHVAGDLQAAEFWGLGLGDPIPVSCVSTQ